MNPRFGNYSKRRLLGNNIGDDVQRLKSLANAPRTRWLTREVALLPDLVGNHIVSPVDKNNANPEHPDFSGTGLRGLGITINGVTFSLYDILNGAVQVGIIPGGGFWAAGGEYTIDIDGTHSNGLTFLHQFDATFGGIRRQGYIGMYVPENGDRPSLRMYYNEPAATNLILNGSFESGDETSWTDTNTSYAVEADATYDYCARHDGTDTGCPPTLTQSVAVSASTVYQVSFASKLADGYFPCSLSLIWKDGGGTILRTDTIIGSSGAAWQVKGGIYTSPSGAATVLVSIHAGDIFSDVSVTGFSLSAVTSFSSLDFYDEKIIVDAYPSKPVNLFGLPQSAFVFASEAVWSASGASAIAASSQRFNTLMRASSANSNDADTIDFSFVVAAGTYTLTILGAKDADAGKLDGYLDGATSASWTGDDLYNASISYNAAFSHSVTFTTGGRHTLRLKVNGKNAASSDYRTYLTCVYLTPSSVSVEA